MVTARASTAPHLTARLGASRKYTRSRRRYQATKMTDAEVSKLIADNLRGIPDFPKPGILFWDVTTLLLDAKVFQATIDAFAKRYQDMKIDVVAGACYIARRSTFLADQTSAQRAGSDATS